MKLVFVTLFTTNCTKISQKTLKLYKFFKIKIKTKKTL